jgi:hypothetical protein
MLTPLEVMGPDKNEHQRKRQRLPRRLGAFYFVGAKAGEHFLLRPVDVLHRL